MHGVNEIIKEASSLPVEERAKIVNSLLRTFNNSDDETELHWTRLAKERLAELKSGKVQSIPGDQVFDKIKNRFED